MRSPLAINSLGKAIMTAIPTQKPKVHELKTDSAVFSAVLSGLKTYEIRKNDRGFEVDDTLILRETQHTGAEMAAGATLIYTGRLVRARVSHVLAGPVYGLAQGWVILSLAKATEPAAQSGSFTPLDRMTVPPLFADEAPLTERAMGVIEGWNAYDTALREQANTKGTVVAPSTCSAASNKAPDELRAALSDALYEALGEALDCTRAWSAWSVGTMRDSDFSSVRDDPARLQEMVDAVLRLKPWKVVEQWLPGKQVGYFFRENHDTLIQCYTPAGPRNPPDFDGNRHAQLPFTGSPG